MEAGNEWIHHGKGYKLVTNGFTMEAICVMAWDADVEVVWWVFFELEVVPSNELEIL